MAEIDPTFAGMHTKGLMIKKYIFQLLSFQLCIHGNCLPYLFLFNLSPQKLWQNCVIISFCCDYHIVTCNVIWMTLNTLNQALLFSLLILILIPQKNF